MPQNLGDLRGTGRVVGVDVHDADIDGRSSKAARSNTSHNRPDRVVLAQVMIQPQLVQPSISVPIEEFDPSRPRTGDLRDTANYEGTEIVNQNDSDLAGIHPMMMLGVAVIAH